MKDKKLVEFCCTEVVDLIENNQEQRLIRCWNILRTMTDEQLVSLEKQVDATIAEVGEEFVGVFIGPTLPF